MSNYPADTLYYPLTFFWYGVIMGVHDKTPWGGRTSLYDYAMQTIYNPLNNYDQNARADLNYLIMRGDLIDTKEFSKRAWQFARDFVVTGRAGYGWDGAPDPLGHLSVSAEGVAERVNPVRFKPDPEPEPKPQLKRKPKPKAYDSRDSFGFGGTFGESEAPF